jgi:hypothetical protein
VQGILNVVSKWAPEAEHRNYARHIYANWKEFNKKKIIRKSFGGVLKLLALCFSIWQEQG